jgi:hypothetical protein
MAEGSGDDRRARQLDAVERELHRRRDTGDDHDLVDTVGEEHQRQRAASERDAPAADDE